MNTISILRLKGLTDAQIFDIICRQQAKQICEAYEKGKRDGCRQGVGALLAAVTYVKDTDAELAS